MVSNYPPLAVNKAQFLPIHLSITATVDDYDRGEDITIIREKFEQGLREDDSNRIHVWAGSGVGLMSQIKPAMVCIPHSFISFLRERSQDDITPLFILHRRKLSKNSTKNVHTA